MQLDVMLCDHAQVSGDKLFVSGAGIDRMRVPADSSEPYLVTFAIGALVTLAPEEAAYDHVVTFRVLTADGRSPWLASDSPRETRSIGGDLILAAGEQAATADQVIACAFTFQGVPFTALGSYALVASVDNVELRRVGFVVESV